MVNGVNGVNGGNEVRVVGKLDAYYCPCGQVMVPPREKCVYCSGSNSNSGKKIEISNKGKLLTFTVLNIPPEGFNAPLILGLIEIESTSALDVKDAKSLNEKSNPKLICQGLPDDVTENDLKIGIAVEIEKRNDLYFFKIV
jgi:uncharacterized OB-fold protein